MTDETAHHLPDHAAACHRGLSHLLGFYYGTDSLANSTLPPLRGLRRGGGGAGSIVHGLTPMATLCRRFAAYDVVEVVQVRLSMG